VALNEAQLLGIEFNKDRELIAATFSPVVVARDGTIPADKRVQFLFAPIGRFIASYRLGRWNDENAKVKEFEPERIFDEVKEFGCLPIYGWNYRRWRAGIQRMERSIELRLQIPKTPWLATHNRFVSGWNRENNRH
jgi:hypothetical protein